MGLVLKIDRIEISHLRVHDCEHDGGDLAAVRQALQRIEGKVNNIMATQAEFQTKIDTINTNTTASAAAAAANADAMTALKAKLDELLTNAGVPADKEAEILTALDGAIATSTALKTFLEATAAGPVTQPEPEPVPVPEPTPGLRRR